MTEINEPKIQDGQQQPVARTPKRRSATGELAEPKLERIRAELNIEKWPAIWNPTHSKTRSKLRPQPRTLQRESTGPDGTKTVSQVTINPIAQLGDLTTDDQRTLYALIKHWEERGKPDHETPFSIRHVARLLHKKGWGTNVIDSVTGSLERLRGTMLVWTRSYRSKDQRVEDLETVYVNILSKLKIVRRKVDGHVTTEAGYFQFDDHILKNLLNNYTKPFLFDVFIDIRGEIALKLYSYLDLIMADKNRFERCTRELFDDIGLRGDSYRNPSKRKQNLENALSELTGIMLTTGVLKSATIEKTKDGKDYKAVFQKTSRAEFLAAEAETSTKFAATLPVVINDYSKAKDPLMTQAEELLLRFHKLFYGVETHYPQSKETAQALNLIALHGVDAARHIVDFALGAAQASNYRPATFGGILQYTSRALSERRRESRPTAPSYMPAAAPERLGSQQFLRGERRLAALTTEQYGKRAELAKAEFCHQQPSMARIIAERSDSAMVVRMVRTFVIRQLDQEPMDLLVVGGDADPEVVNRKLGLQILAL